MKKNNFVLPIIIILLLFFVPCSIYGIIRHNKEEDNHGNPNHLPKVGNTLYFYDDKNELLGTYECTTDNCDRALTSVDDTINIHENDDGTGLPYINNDFVFINDNNTILMYAMKNSMVITKLKLLKNYGVGIKDNLLIMQYEDGTYGLYNMNTAQFIITPSDGYTYMGLIGKKTLDGKVDTDKIIVCKDSLYYLIDINQNKLTTPSANPIYYYEDNYVYYKSNNDIYMITDYTLNKIVDDVIVDIHFFSKCNAYITNDDVLKVYSKDYQNLIYEKKYSTSDLEMEMKEDTLVVKEKGSNEYDEINLSPSNSDNPEEKDDKSESSTNPENNNN